MDGFINRSIIRHDFLTGEGRTIYKGRTTLEAGYIFAPYIPLQIQPIQTNDFTPSQEIRSRYATRVVNNRFYGSITVDEFDSLSDD
jgi:hypothetical protein